MKGSIILLFALAAAVAAETNVCPAEQESDWTIELLLRHEVCNKFYKCTYGVPVEQECPADLWFNLDTWQCDWRENVDCSDRVVPGEPEEPEPVEPEPQEPEPVEPEPQEPEPVEPEPQEPEPEVSSSEEEVPEPAPEQPEPEASSSEEVVVVPEPEDSSPEGGEPEETAPEETNPEFQPNGCPVDPNVHWLLPNEKDCNLFFYCVWGERVPRQCPGGLHFNRNLQVCDWPNDAGCAVSANKHYGGRAMYFK